jgi:hypothetical protein
MTAPEPLGPTVTEEFPAAVGLHELLGGTVGGGERAAGTGSGSASAPAPSEVPPVEFSPQLFLSALRLLDVVASRALGVEPEEAETVEAVAAAIAPLVQYYASGRSTVVALWGNLVVALVGVGYAKWLKVEAARAARARADEGAVSASDAR